ncbi:GNAT family N-acetyltransferase [Roseateles sp. SL47]|uniref:GNAT family N-acetyltransferase n=1 Tax=Roseateles sp. SL47 TaxID=2995138 RepID=UPI00226E0575|nr:GNAT family N-acetyltransferase [Roseateles sp. SL47]WAC74065.1 GNAT family N-acetyltransferase [Roseateles sp. SL47]
MNPTVATPPGLDLSAPAAALRDLAWRAEQAGLNAAASPRETLIEGWLLRLSPGKARRSRCINALGTTGQLPIDELLARSRRSFEQAGLPVLMRMTPFSQPPELDAWLASRGWKAFDPSDVKVMPSLELLDTSDGQEASPLMALTREAYADQVGRLRGSTPEEIHGHAERLRTAPVPHQAFCLQADDGSPLAYGQIAVDGSIVGLFDIMTSPEHRGQGHGYRLCAALLRTARQQGASEAYLQVAADNTPAQSLYARLGFQHAYRYHYRSDDPRAWP